MADLKISQLTGATTPLAGTEILPIVQSGSTVKVSVNNLTAGKEVPASKVTVATGSDALSIYIKGRSSDNQSNIFFVNAADSAQYGYINANASEMVVSSIGARPLSLGASGATAFQISTAGNLVPVTAGKGIDFSANTPAAGMTSQLLNAYEEGTWTPNQGAGLTVVGTFSSSGKYTRIGRQVTVAGQFDATTSVSAAASAICCTNLPFSAATAGLGSMTDAAVSASSTCLTSAANLYVITAIAATTTIYFSVTYFV